MQLQICFFMASGPGKHKAGAETLEGNLNGFSKEMWPRPSNGIVAETRSNQTSCRGFPMATSEIPTQTGFFMPVTRKMKRLKIIRMQGSYKGIVLRQSLCT